MWILSLPLKLDFRRTTVSRELFHNNCIVLLFINHMSSCMSANYMQSTKSVSVSQLVNFISLNTRFYCPGSFEYFFTSIQTQFPCKVEIDYSWNYRYICKFPRICKTFDLGKKKLQVFNDCLLVCFMKMFVSQRKTIRLSV